MSESYIDFTPRAKRYLKKIKDQRLKDEFIAAFETIRIDHTIGQAKRGDLAGVYCYDLRYESVSYEIAYRVVQADRTVVVVILAGTRENFYEELKRLL